jgi:hypothetical protein
VRGVFVPFGGRRLLALYAKRRRKERLTQRRQGQIDATDTQIGHLVYELYGLTDDEIAIVEGSERAAMSD